MKKSGYAGAALLVCCAALVSMAVLLWSQDRSSPGVARTDSGDAAKPSSAPVPRPVFHPTRTPSPAAQPTAPPVIRPSFVAVASTPARPRAVATQIRPRAVATPHRPRPVATPRATVRPAATPASAVTPSPAPARRPMPSAKAAIVEFDATATRLRRGQRTFLCVGVDPPAVASIAGVGRFPSGITSCRRVAPQSSTTYVLRVRLGASFAVRSLTVRVGESSGAAVNRNSTGSRPRKPKFDVPL